MDYTVYTIVRDSGERFPCLIDGRGVPVHFPLLFSFRDREAGGVARMRNRLLRIADLYRATTAMLSENEGPPFNLDQAIATRAIEIRDIESALYWFEEEQAQDFVSEPHAKKKLASSSAYMRNQRISAWADFMEWALRTSNWTRVSRASRDAREATLAMRLRALLEDAVLPMSASREVQPLSGREIEVLHDLLGPDKHGKFPHSPFEPAAAQRNWVLYQILRWSGMRLGEALKLRVEDIPPREAACEKLLREIDERALRISIVRRVDDKLDARRNEPSVKRLGRSVPMPDRVIALVWDYIDRLPNTTPYLIRTDDMRRPLSYSQASHICDQVRDPAAQMFKDLHDDDPHTLKHFRWHRLRHTRAVEMLPEYFPNDVAEPLRQRQFCDAFGWARLTSADPYLKLLHRDSGEKKWAKSLSKIGV